MFILTKKVDDVDSCTFASMDDDGRTIIQMFVNKDDAITYNVHLEAIDQTLFVTEVEGDNLEKLCGALGHPYSIVEPGDLVIPKLESMMAYLRNDSIQETDA